MKRHTFAYTFALLGFLCLLPSVQPVLHAQYRQDPNAITRLREDFTGAIQDVAAWYDAPVFLIYLVNRYDIVPQDAKPIVIGPTDAELALARELSVPGAHSAGSIEPLTVPHLLIGVRLLHVAGSALLDPAHENRGELRQVLGFYKALVYTQVTTQFAKNLVYRARPDLTDSKSFFSGHTSTAFAMSSYLQRELDDAIVGWEFVEDSPVLRNALRGGAAAVCYGWAGYVGYSRMRDNRHYLTDVLVGAAIGSLVGHLIYGQVNGSEHGQPRIDLGAGADGPFLALHLEF